MDQFDKSSAQVPTAPSRDYNKTQPVSAESYDKKKALSKSELSSIVFTNYKADMHNVSAHTVAGSTLPLVQLNKDEEAGNYNPFEHRKVSHPTTDSETLIHLLKGSLGSGILSMPLAFSNAGLWFGLVATVTVGAICTYCVHILVKCERVLCKRAQIPSLDYAGIAETAFLFGPKSLNKWSRVARFFVKLFLVLYLLGTCCVYIVLVASSIKQVVEFFSGVQLNIRLYILMLLLPLILSNFVRRLKYLVWYSFVANILMGFGLGITLYYVLTDLPSVTTQYAIANVSDWPKFFGTAIFAIEGMGVVLSLENNMKNPTHFIGCPGVLNIWMAFVVTLYAIFGFLGFLKYGAATEASITLNLPVEDMLAQSIKLVIALAIFLTYSLQFYVPMDIFWQKSLTVTIAIVVPNLETVIPVVGAVTLSTLGLMFPAIIETITFWNDPGVGRFRWRLIKNALFLLFGILGFLSGSYVSIAEIIWNNE